MNVEPSYQSPRPDEDRVFNFRKTRQTSPNLSSYHSTTASSSEVTPASSERQIPSPIRIPKNNSSPLKSNNSSNNRKGRGPPSPWDTISPRSETSVTSSSRRRRDPSPPSHAARSDSESVEESELLVCDYETSATILYKLLESSQWDLALQRCRSHPLEVRTWVQRSSGDSPKSSKTIRWKVLPLHAAIVFKAPFLVVEGLLEQHPRAASSRDDQGMLPLHLAFRHYDAEHEQTVALLMKRYPKGCHMPDKRSRTPLQLAPDSAQFSTNVLKLYSQIASNQLRSADSDKEMAIRKSATDPDALKLQDQGKVVSDYERRIELLKQEHESNIKAVHRQNQKTMVQVRLDAEEERQELMKRHHQEMDELRDLLSREVGREGQLSASLQAEVTTLREQLEQSRKKQSAMTTMMKEFRMYHDELLRHLRDEVLVDQQRLLELVLQQQSELDAAHSMRDHLLRTVLQQDGEDQKLHTESHQKLHELAERLKLRLETMASASQQPPLMEAISTSVASPPVSVPQGVKDRKMSRMDEGRNDDESEAGGSDAVSALTDHSF